MDFNIEVRLEQLQSLDNFISYSKDKVHSILDCLKWNAEDTLKESSLIRCSIDPNHRIAANTVEAHSQKCLLNKEGYNPDDDFLSEPTGSGSSTIQINDRMKVEILSEARQTVSEFKSGWNGQDSDPKTSDRLFATFTRDERLALYNYAVEHTTGPPELPEFNILKPVGKEGSVLTEEELRIKERDAKRRRIKYKSVHTNNKNYTEQMREVINGQMELYYDWLNEGDGGEKHDNREDPDATEKDSYNYAESVSKQSSHSRSSSTALHNSDKYSDYHSYGYSREHSYSDNTYRDGRSRSNERKHRYRQHNHANGSHRRHRSRSRSSGRRRSKRSYRSRSRSRHKHYSKRRR